MHRFGTCYNFTIHRFKILLNKISNNKRNEIKHIQIDKFLNDVLAMYIDLFLLFYGIPDK